MATIAIRSLGPEDMHAMRALLATFGRAFEEEDRYCAAQPGGAYLETLLGTPDFFAITAAEAEDVVGGLTAYALQKPERERSEIYIFDLAVAGTHRLRGIATQMIEHLRSIAAARGAGVIFVQAEDFDEPAIRLYEKFGAREEVLHFNIPVGDEH